MTYVNISINDGGSGYAYTDTGTGNKNTDKKKGTNTDGLGGFFSAIMESLKNVVEMAENAAKKAEEAKKAEDSLVDENIPTIKENIKFTPIQQEKDGIPYGLAVKLDNMLGAGFSAKVEEVAKNINCDPNDLVGLMQSESSMDPTCVNPKSGTSGLIQLTWVSANEIGMSYEEFLQYPNMSAIEQLDIAERYFKRAMSYNSGYYTKEHRLTAGDLYALNFLPTLAGNEVICSSDSEYYNWNPDLDDNKDNYITKTDLENIVARKYQELIDYYNIQLN